MRRLGVRPKRSLGQNFLVDPAYLGRIVEAAELSAEDRVLEVGPGPGNLTAGLAARAGRVVAVELDDRLQDELRAKFAAQPGVTIVHGDILALDACELMGEDAGYKVVANLPYYITSAVLRHLLEAACRPAMMVVMVQREVAERMCAGPGAMSLLAVSVQFYAAPRVVFRVPAGAFYPRPKVESAVVRLDVRAEPAVTDVPAARFFEVVRAGFGQKRKQLVNSLSAGLGMGKDRVYAALGRAGLDPRRRAETLALAEWRALCLALDV